MNGLFALFKGDTGSGKSVGALSFPEPVVLDHDKKMPAIANKHFPGKKIPFKQFESVLELGNTIEDWLKNGCPFETIIGDSVTSLSYDCIKTLDDIKGTSVLKMMSNVKTSSKKYETIELRGYDYYNAEDGFIKFYLDGLKTLWHRPGKPYHVILIAHVLQSESTDIRTKVVTKSRSIVTAGKKIAAYIPAQFDEAWHFGTSAGDIFSDDPDTARVKHFCITEAIGEDFAKTAYRLPAKIDFTNGSLYELIKLSLIQSSQTETQRESMTTTAKPKLLDI